MQTSPEIAVPKPASADQVRQYVADGFVVMDGLVTPAEVEEMRRDVLDIMRGRYPCATLSPLPGDLSDPEMDDVLDDLAELVLRMKGDVVVVPAERMPSTTGAVAIYRY